jgi:hypothetical protein
MRRTPSLVRRSAANAALTLPNANDFSAPVVVVGSNAFNAVPADRGQTQLFLPYHQPKRVAVTWNGKSDLTWQLNGYKETASKTSPSC